MSKVPVEETKRNLELIGDYKNGMSAIRLVSKYKISSTRIYQILNKYQIEKNRK